ncbi:MAG: GTPase ObgE [Chloroflexota bacterium]
MIDVVEIRVQAGNGGDGAITFRHEKGVPYGGPDGGDGGGGGDVVLIAESSTNSLRAFKGRRVYKASDGENGRGKKKYGGRGDDLLLRVPPGTVIYEKDREGYRIFVSDLEKLGQAVIIAKGGRGGWGNVRYTSSTNQAPRIAQKGEAGEERDIILEMRLIADVGIIGYPNVGKSSLLAAASAAKPKIASYPFTTLEPVLGVVETGQQSFILAEIPGLIEGAHLGRGLGHDFLRHALRTKALIQLIDGSSEFPVEDMQALRKELSLFDNALAEKEKVAVVNKIDLPEVRAKIPQTREAFSRAGMKVRFISAATGEGVSELMSEVAGRLEKLAGEAKPVEVKEKVFRPQPRGVGHLIDKGGDTFVIRVPELERIVARVDMTDPEVSRQVDGQIVRMKINKALERAGIKPGDKVRCGDYEWKW